MINNIKQKFQSEEKKRLLSNFISLSILQGANYILPLITFPYLVRVLGVENFGLIAFAGATIAYFNILTDYGFNLTATREVSIYREDRAKLIEIFSSVMIIKFILMIISFVLLTILILSFDKFRKDAIIYFLTFGMVIGQVLFPIWFFQGMEKMKYITYLNLLSKLIFTMAIFIFIHSSEDVYKVPLINSLGYIVAGILSLILIKKYFAITFKFQDFNTLLFYFKDGFHLFLSSFASNFYRRFNVIVLGLLTNNLYTGYYAIAEKIVQVIQTLQNIIGNVLFPYFSKRTSLNKKYFFNLNKKYLKFVVLGYLIIVIFTIILSPYLTYIIAGMFENKIILNLKIMSIIILIGGLNYYFGILGLISMGYKKEFTLSIVIAGLSNIILSFILVSFLKDIGASLSFVFSESILLIFILKYYLKIRKELNA